RGAWNESARLSRRERRARHVRPRAQCVRARTATLPSLRRAPRGHARDRRPRNCTLRALPAMSRAALRPPPTPDSQLAAMRASVRESCADRPGIYRMHGAGGEVVYVGKSKKVRTLLLEMHLIKRLRPRFNVAMKRDAHHYAFIKVTRGPAPKLLVVRGPTDDTAATYYGPFYGVQ